jgi:ribosomal protein S18 acetylase RimI-like enzyme
MTHVIRPARPEDAALWRDLMGHYASFYKTSVSDAGLETVWDWIHDADNDFWCDLIETDGKVIGFTQYQLMHRSLSGEMVIYLSDLYVDPDVRGGGAGRALIDHVIGFAKTRGIPSVRWLTQETNYRARGLYDSYGPKTEFILYNVAP